MDDCQTPPWDEVRTKLYQIHNLCQQNNSPVDENWFVDLRDYAPNSTLLTLRKPFDRSVLIKYIIAIIPAGSSGTLTIGDRQIPISVNSPIPPEVAMIVRPATTITLSSINAGNIYLELMGYSLRNDQWRLIE